ncbi:hypothetical protein LWI29_016713 [Acer saccharum]|uniref:non-specific serine/threonine protein kinase n=1 Tax=Acer saccharum TaxID=4024 RepID=A0AA39SEM3_ACESA|nr:hypothetical protein LWI29_016713 [Acer saccharum]
MRMMMMLLRPPPPPFLLLLFAFFWVCPVHVAQAQTNQAQPTTDLEEARALNSIFQQWRISANQEHWNISGELCSGDAIATDTSDIDSSSGPNPYIKCVCTYNNNTLCHITRFTVGINALSGELPKELGKMTDMRSLNVVANNLTIDSSNSSLNSALPFGLNCLQRNFPCNRGSGIYYNFSIKAGGPQITSSNGIVFERDNETLGPASYFVTGTTRWGVSNVGSFADNNNPQYKSSSSSQFTNTLDSELFQTARISASSLRYYGLGLENGNYNVTLRFAETAILDTTSWQSVGRRVFDIYIQGNRVQKDFDIKKEAGGASKRALERLFTARVSENYLEIHLFWAGKGTCCIPAQDFIPSVSNIPPTSPKKNRTGLIAGIVVGVGLLILLSIIAILWIVRSRNKPRDDDEVLLGIDVKPYTFSYSVLKTATEDFSPANKLGEGGFGAVYKGKLSDEREIAVKQLSVASHQGKSQFVAEIVAISAVQHRNLVKLYGCCIEGLERLLVYEYLENKSLDQALFDFGLAKLYDDKKTHISTRVAGTIGYLAPEYAMRGHLTEKTDVFAFGVVALEIVSGRPNSDSSLDEEQIYLLEWAWNLHENNRQVELVDSRLPEFNEEEVKRMIGVALLCTQTLPSLRPPMSRVVAMLCGDMEVSPVTTKPGYLTDWKYDDTTTTGSFMSSTDKATIGTEYNSNFTSSSTTMVADAQHSPANVTKPILHDIIGDAN